MSKIIVRIEQLIINKINELDSRAIFNEKLVVFLQSIIDLLACFKTGHLVVTNALKQQKTTPVCSV